MVARNWLYAAVGVTGRSVLKLIVPLTRGSTTMLRPVIAAMVRATASMSAFTKFSVIGSRDRCAWGRPGIPAVNAQATQQTASRCFMFGAWGSFILAYG